MQRYITQLPAAGEIVIFDRSWYNRPGVERVMGFTPEAKVKRFLETLPHVENRLIESDIVLRKYFLDVSPVEQERRFKQRIKDPVCQWKLSPMDVESYRKRWDYTEAYAEMIQKTDTHSAPWWKVVSNDKKRARINVIIHLLASIPYERVKFKKPHLGNRQDKPKHVSPDLPFRNVVPDANVSERPEKRSLPVEAHDADVETAQSPLRDPNALVDQNLNPTAMTGPPRSTLTSRPSSSLLISM